MGVGLKAVTPITLAAGNVGGNESDLLFQVPLPVDVTLNVFNVSVAVSGVGVGTQTLNGVGLADDVDALVESTDLTTGDLLLPLDGVLADVNNVAEVISSGGDPQTLVASVTTSLTGAVDGLVIVVWAIIQQGS